MRSTEGEGENRIEYRVVERNELESIVHTGQGQGRAEREKDNVSIVVPNTIVIVNTN
jgi:replication fork clamp-binding protein CrfC